MNRRLLHVSLVPMLLLLASEAVAVTITVEVLLKAQPNLPSCTLAVYRAEKEIPAPFEKLCSIKAEAKSIIRSFDQTGKALADAKTRACLCGANAILILSNSSETQPAALWGSGLASHGSGSFMVKEVRNKETVTALGLRVAAPSPTPAPTMPPNEMKAGFRDLVWGDSLTDVFLPLEGDDPKALVRRFVRSSDELSLAKVPVSQVAYLFAKSKFCGAEISFQMPEWGQLKENLSALWGAPQPCQPGAKSTCTWWANKAEGAGDTIAMLLQGDGPIGTLLIGNPDLLGQAERAKREAESGL